MKTKILVDVREYLLSFLFSVPACSFVKSSGGKIPAYLSLDSTNKRGKGKISKSSEVFFYLLLFADTLKNKWIV